MTDPSHSLLPQSSSAEYHDAHLAFARAGIVEAAAHREPVLDRLRSYTADVMQAERDRTAVEIEKLREALTVLRDACGHCLAADRPPSQQMIETADAALRGEWVLSP